MNFFIITDFMRVVMDRTETLLCNKRCTPRTQFDLQVPQSRPSVSIERTFSSSSFISVSSSQGFTSSMILLLATRVGSAIHNTHISLNGTSTSCKKIFQTAIPKLLDLYGKYYNTLFYKRLKYLYLT